MISCQLNRFLRKMICNDEAGQTLPNHVNSWLVSRQLVRLVYNAKKKRENGKRKKENLEIFTGTTVYSGLVTRQTLNWVSTNLYL